MERLWGLGIVENQVSRKKREHLTERNRTLLLYEKGKESLVYN